MMAEEFDANVEAPESDVVEAIQDYTKIKLRADEVDEEKEPENTTEK